MKILIIIPSLGSGGAERVMINLANQLTFFNQSVFLVVCTNRNALENKLSGSVEIKKLGKKNVSSSIPEIYNVLKEIRPEIVVGTMSHINCILSFIKKFYKLDFKLILTEHNVYSINSKKLKISKRKIMQLLISKLYRNADGIIYVSKGVKKDFEKNFPNIKNIKDKVIYNPITRITEDEINLKYSTFKPYILAIGRLTYQKGFDRLINMFLEFRKTHPLYKLIILGEGELHESLENIICKNRLSDSVILGGFENNISNIIENADFFVLSSRWEGFGNVIVECMSCGTPIISYACPSGPDEIISHMVDGYLVKNQDEQEFINAMNLLSENHALKRQFSLNGIKKAQSFAPNIIAKQYIDFFEEILK